MLRRLLFRFVLWLSRGLLPPEVRATFAPDHSAPNHTPAGLPTGGRLSVSVSRGAVILWADPCGVGLTPAGAEYVAGLLAKAAKMVRFGPLAGRGVSVRPDVSPRQ